MAHPPRSIFDLSLEELTQQMAPWGMPPFRARQIFDWVYRHGVADPMQMTNLSQSDRRQLAERIDFVTGRVVQHQQASDGTQKLLIQFASPDRALAVVENKPDQAECVMIPTPQRRTACISSQVGCPVGCTFCASGIGGLQRNLTAGQIVQQVWQLAHHLPATKGISHVVFMGMGEPLSNFDPVVRALTILTANWGLGLSARRLTVSTVGLPAQIRRLADRQLALTLAISLHAPNDELRRRIIPWAEFVAIDQLIEAGRYYFERTGREVTLEYILLGGENDRSEHARELAEVATKLRCNVNLIRYNEVEGLPHQRPVDRDVHAFTGSSAAPASTPTSAPSC